MDRSRARGYRVAAVGSILLASYLALAALAVAYPFCKRASDPANSELAGVPAIVVGLPWSLLLIEGVQLVRPQVEGIGPLLGMTVPGMLINALLLYRASYRAGSARSRGRTPPPRGGL